MSARRLGLLFLMSLAGCGDDLSVMDCKCPGPLPFESGSYEYVSNDYRVDGYPEQPVVPFPHAATNVTNLKVTIDRDAGEVIFTYNRGATSVVERWARQ